MEKEQLDILLKLLSEMKEAYKELERAFRNKDETKLNAGKRKIIDLQTKIGKEI